MNKKVTNKTSIKKTLSPHEKMLKKFGITEHVTTGLGFNPTTKKWYGWSQRAIAGFGVGSSFKVKKGDVLARHFKIGYYPKTLADAKKMAKTFSDDVS